MATPPVPGLRPLSLFTVSPALLAGRQALRGFQFQTVYIMYVLAGFAAGKEDFAAARIEAVQDLDALIRDEGIWIERYYQIKSKQEGGGNWTLNLLDRGGVLKQFFDLYRVFQSRKLGDSRKIELVLAVDGDLGDELIQLRDQGSAARGSEAALLGILCANDAVSRNASYERAMKEIRTWCRDNLNLLLSESGAAVVNSAQFNELIQTVSLQAKVSPEETGRTLAEIISEVTPALEGFILSLKFDSRLGPHLEEAVMARLIESGDLSPGEARAVSDRLRRSIEDESALPTPTEIDHGLLREWLGVPKRTVLQTKPSPSADNVKRQEALDYLLGILQKEQVVLFYGLSKVGKSQLISALIDHAHREGDYFWFTLLGDPSDLDRLTRQLAIWTAERTGRWQTVDDLETGAAQPSQAFERLSQSPVSGCFIVLDDCHKATAAAALELLSDLVCRGWQESRLIMISERKIPAAAAAGAREIALGGLNPKESVQFATNLGLDLSDSAAQFAMFSVQVDGHPIMLRAAAEELPSKPSFADVLALAQRIPSVGSAQDFLNDLSNRIFFDLLRTSDQRAWLARLGAISFPLTEGLALKIAELTPRLQVFTADWIYLRSLILDELRKDRYSVPTLLQRLATLSVSDEERKRIQVTAARYVFRTGLATRRFDFWDLHHAIFALVGCGEYDEAAALFVRIYPSLVRARSLRPFELILTVMNGKAVHSKISDPFARRLMLQAEFDLRMVDEAAHDYSRVLELLRRMRVLCRPTMGPGVPVGRVMVHVGVAFVKIRRLKEAQNASPWERWRTFNPLQTALRVALASKHLELLTEVLTLYGGLYLLATRPNVELLKDALLSLPREGPWPISVHALISVYSRYASASTDRTSAMALLERHAEVYRALGRDDAYFACEHAVATILHDGLSDYSRARARMSSVLCRAGELQLSPMSLARAEMLIGDTYWAESDYPKSAEQYGKVLHADFDSEQLHEIIWERFCDSLIFMRRYEEAANASLTILRSEHSRQDFEQRAHLYARLAYAYAEDGALRKAAIACLGLSRVAESSHSDALDLLSGHVAGWVIQHFSYSDPATPKFDVKIRDSVALSEPLSVDQLRAWRDLDPFSTRRIVLVATQFELLKDWRRSEFLYQKAMTILRRSEVSAKSYRAAAYVYMFRLARIHIWRGKLALAATELKEGFEHVMLDAAAQGTAVAGRGAGLYAQLLMIDPAVQTCSDGDVMSLFGLIAGHFAAEAGVLAWARYRESEILFGRLAVQAAKRRLHDAMQLAQSSSQPELYWLCVKRRLFQCAQQIHTGQIDWLQDALGVAVTLASDQEMAGYRQAFGELVYNLSRVAAEGPFAQAASVMDRFENERREHAFLVALYALWWAATRNQILAASRNTVEAYLRGIADFLHASDFL